MLIKRISVYIFPVLLFLGLELVFYFIDYIYLSAAVLTILFFIYLKYLIDDKVISPDFAGLSVLPILFYAAVISFLIIIDSVDLKHYVIAFFSFIMMIYFDMTFFYYYAPWKYKPNALENISSVINLLTFFLIAITLYAVSTLLYLPSYLLAISLFVIVYLLLNQYFWINKISLNYKFVCILIMTIIIAEFFLVLSFLPMNFYVISILLTILYYFITGIYKAKLLQKLNNKMIWRYLTISVVMLLIIIFTSQWT